jgi:hypothetical protein
MPSQAVALQHRDEILQRIEAGEYLATIAQSLGLAGKGQAISNALAADPEYQAARALGLEAKLARREQEMETVDHDNVPRARELLSHARWRAERECPERWGQRSQVAVTAPQTSEYEVLARIKSLVAANPQLANLVADADIVEPLPAGNTEAQSEAAKPVDANASHQDSP